MTERFELDRRKDKVRGMIQDCTDTDVIKTVEQLKQMIQNDPDLGYMIKSTIETTLSERINEMEIFDKDVHSKTASDIERHSLMRQELVAKASIIAKIKEGLPKLFL